MAVTVAHFTANQNDGTAASLATTVPATTIGNGMVVGIFWKGAETVTSVTGGGTYADSGAGKLARPTDGNVQFFGCSNLTSSVTTVTVNWSDANANSIEAYCWEVTGQNTGSMFDPAFGTGTASSGASVTTGSFTPANGLIISLACSDATGTASGDSGYTVEFNPLNQGIVAQDKPFVSGAQTTTATYGNAQTKAAIMSVVVNTPATASIGFFNQPFHPGASPGIRSARFMPSNWWPYNTSVSATVALTGASATFSPGTLGVQHTNALTGASTTFSEGTLTPSTSKALAGSNASVASGILGVTHTNSLVGQSSAFTPGIVSSALNVPLPGSSATFGAGTVTPVTGIFAALTGESASFAAGSLTPSGGDVPVTVVPSITTIGGVDRWTIEIPRIPEQKRVVFRRNVEQRDREDVDDIVKIMRTLT